MIELNGNLRKWLLVLNIEPKMAVAALATSYSVRNIEGCKFGKRVFNLYVS